MATKTDTEEPSRPSTPLNDEEESDDEEDNVQVTIREVKAPTIAPAVKAYKMKQGQQKQIDIDEIPSVNGYPLIEIELDNFEEKPWKMPGADISDYFNYGFDEDSWRGYCDKQKRLRAETQTRASYIFPPNRVVNDTRHQPQVIQTITRLDNFSHEQANLLGDNQLPGVGNDGENADELQDSKKRSYPSMDMLPPGMPPFGMPPMPFSLPPGMMPPAFPPLPGMVPGIPSFDPFLDEGRERDERKRRDRDRDRDYDRDYDRYEDRRRRDRSEERERKHKRKYRDEDDDDRSHKHKRSRKHRRSRSRSVEREHTPVNDE